MKIMIIPHLPNALRAKPIARTFAEQGHEVHLITWSMPYPLNWATIADNFRNSWRRSDTSDQGVLVHKVRRLPLICPPINRWWFKRQISSLFDRYELDLVFSETYFSETEPPLDLPLYYDMSDEYEAFAEIYGSRFYKLAFRLLSVHSTIRNQIVRSNAVFCVSDDLMVYAKNDRTDGVYKFPNGVEDWAFDLPYLTGKKYSLVYVTTYGKWSKVLPLIKVVTDLRSDIADITLTLIGDGPEVPEAKRYVEANNLSGFVTFKGNVTDRQELFTHINQHEVCLNISEKNRFRDAASPMKVFEYSALAKKIVSSELKEVKALDFANVFFFDNDKWETSLKEAIQVAFISEIDPKAVRDEAARYSWPVLLNRAEEIFRETLRTDAP